MMKATYKTFGNRLMIEVQGEGVKDLFKGLSQIQEVFETAQTCGACGSANIRLQARNVDDNDYYEAWCSECKSVLQFGQHKKGGTLFAKRKDDQNNYLPAGGWKKYERPATK